VAVLACRVQPPFQDVAGDHERSGDDAIGGDLRVGADADQRRPGAQRVPGFGGIEPVQATPCVRQELIDRGSGHAADPTGDARGAAAGMPPSYGRLFPEIYY
jgi:hypothetical protein